VSLVHTFRPHQGQAYTSQVRNNGLRALRDHAGITPGDSVLFLDGDTMLACDAVEKHRAFAAGGAELVIPYRHMLGQEVSKGVDAEVVLARGVVREGLLDAGMDLDLIKRHRRYQRHLFLSRIGLGKGHKPKLIGAHHAVKFARLLEVNGWDEEYLGWGFEDDDLSRRLRSARVRTKIAVREIEAFHLWHATRAPERLKDATGYKRWSRTDLPTRCVRGIENPLGQPVPGVRVVG
jgi:GT2 family glycosyltransferase